MPGRPFAEWLNASGEPVRGELRVVAGDIEANSIGSWLEVLLSDAFYWTDNDLVVHTRSMYGGTLRNDGAATFVLDRGGKVTHFNYFANERTAKAPPRVHRCGPGPQRIDGLRLSAAIASGCPRRTTRRQASLRASTAIPRRARTARRASRTLPAMPQRAMARARLRPRGPRSATRASRPTGGGARPRCAASHSRTAARRRGLARARTARASIASIVRRSSAVSAVHLLKLLRIPPATRAAAPRPAKCAI